MRIALRLLCAVVALVLLLRLAGVLLFGWLDRLFLMNLAGLCGKAVWFYRGWLGSKLDRLVVISWVGLVCFFFMPPDRLGRWVRFVRVCRVN